ncbi:MAG: tRNA pseudouridine(55) synthase TruB [Bacteroidales bacterium]|nr:tRNA pseudouridine(55) synthase TruB [Bacteroidales bacterium]
MHQFDFQKGELILIDKPYQWTSFDVVKSVKGQARRMSGIKRIKVGHAGTLDPLATGLLLICTGKKTKEIESYQAQEKEYTGTIYLGATTPCFDLEQAIDQRFDISKITTEQVQHTATQFLGEIDQTPPMFSAIKIEGKRAYEYARNDEEVKIKSKKVTIFEFELTRIELPEIDFRIRCSKGTYIRSIARDFGLALNNGAHLTALRRTKIGDFDVKDAISPAAFKALFSEKNEDKNN